MSTRLSPKFQALLGWIYANQLQWRSVFNETQSAIEDQESGDPVQPVNPADPRRGPMVFPDDVLRLIFAYSSAINANYPRAYRRDAASENVASISLVCRRWMAVLLNTPEVWGRLLDIDRQSPRCFESFLNRSRGSGFHLISTKPLLTRDRDRLRSWDQVMVQFDRCVTFYVQASVTTDFRPIIPFLTLKAPSLVSFTICEPRTSSLWSDINMPSITEARHEERSLFSSRAGKLEALHLWEPPSMLLWSLSGAAFGQLTELTITMTNVDQEALHPRDGMHQWLLVLRNLPRLRILAIVHAIHVPAYISDTPLDCNSCVGDAQLLNLQNIQLAGNLKVYGHLFARLALPSTTNFDFDLFIDKDPAYITENGRFVWITSTIGILVGRFCRFIRRRHSPPFEGWFIDISRSHFRIRAKRATGECIFNLEFRDDVVNDAQFECIIYQIFLTLSRGNLHGVVDLSVALADYTYPETAIGGLRIHLSTMLFVRQLHLNNTAFELLTDDVLRQRPGKHQYPSRVVDDDNHNALFPILRTLFVDATVVLSRGTWNKVGGYLLWRYEGDRGRILNVVLMGTRRHGLERKLERAFDDWPSIIRGSFDVGEMHYIPLPYEDDFEWAFSANNYPVSESSSTHL